MKHSSVYPMSIDPVRPGVYGVVSYGNTNFYSMWEGKKWHLACTNKHHAATASRRSTYCYTGSVKGWYGLVKP